MKLALYVRIASVIVLSRVLCCAASSLVGDPLMKSADIRLLIESWNFCNNAGSPALSNLSFVLPPDSVSGCYYHPITTPRFADCSFNGVPLVDRQMNRLTFPDAIPHHHNASADGIEYYTQEKGRFLSEVCSAASASAWAFWTIMFKNGNFNQTLHVCRDTTPPRRTVHSATAVSAGEDDVATPLRLMNQPIVYHQQTRALQSGSKGGGIYGTYDLMPTAVDVIEKCIADSSDPHPCISARDTTSSFFSVTYTRSSAVSASWLWSYQLRTSQSHPWLMLYHRADSVDNGGGGYPWKAGGMLLSSISSADHPHWFMSVFLNITTASASSNFYFPELGGCFKNDGKSACDGDLNTDVTRYVNFILDPTVIGGCAANAQESCPLFHRTSRGDKIYRNETEAIPYSCYRGYCAPAGSRGVSAAVCDPFSNPNPQELHMLLPCDEWSALGFPRRGEGWINDARTWTLDLGALTRQLYYYTDAAYGDVNDINPRFVSVEIGPEVFTADALMEWQMSALDIFANDSNTSAQTEMQ